MIQSKIIPNFIFSSLLLCGANISPTVAFTFIPAWKSQKALGPMLKSHRLKSYTTKSRTLSTSSLQMSDIIADNYFMLNGIAAGIILSIGTSVSRNVQADQAWEERIKTAQARQMAESGNTDGLTELDLRAQIAENSSSMYGPEAMERRERQTRERKDDFDVDDEEEDDELSPEEVLEFEKMYGVKYDPYYDQAYYEDELPNDMEFSVDSYFGDRIYENGETFFKDGGKYYRKGSKPKSSFFNWGKK